MIYLYDTAICDDLQKSFNPDNVDNPVVKVISPEGILALVGQIKEDNCTFPIVALQRHPEVTVATSRQNFTATKFGVECVYDKDTNNIYYEKSVPIDLQYDLSILTTSTADMDELVKEILFKYSNMYFLTLQLPYECKRKVRFGIKIAPDSLVETKSSSFEYLSTGKLYESSMTLVCEGCVLVSYTPPKHMENYVQRFEIK